MASGNTLLIYTALSAEFPTTNYAVLTVSNDHPVLEFPETPNQIVLFRGVMPRNYSGGGVTATIYWKAAAATTGAAVWAMEWERMLGFNITGGTSFASVINSTPVTTNATLGVVNTSVISFTNAQIDAVVAGDPFRVRLLRVADNAGDNMVGAAHFLQLELRET